MNYPLNLAFLFNAPIPGFNVTDAQGQPVWHAKVTWDRETYDGNFQILDATDGDKQIFDVRTISERSLLAYRPLGGDSVYQVTGVDGLAHGTLVRRGASAAPTRRSTSGSPRAATP